MNKERNRWVSFQELRKYLPLGRDASRDFARRVGAEVNIGIHKFVYDLDKIDAALEEMTAVKNGN